MKRANPKKANKRKGKQAEIVPPNDERKRKLMNANKIGSAIVMYYLHAEYGWGDRKRLPEFFNQFAENLAYCNQRATMCARKGVEWEPKFLISGLQKYTDHNLWNAIHIDDRYAKDAHQLVFLNYLGAFIEYRWTKKRNGKEVEQKFNRQKVNDFVEAYTSLLDEVMNPSLKFGGRDMIAWCKEETQFDTDEVILWKEGGIE